MTVYGVILPVPPCRITFPLKQLSLAYVSVHSTKVLTLDTLRSKEIFYPIVRDEFFPFTEEKVHSDSDVWK